MIVIETGRRNHASLFEKFSMNGTRNFLGRKQYFLAVCNRNDRLMRLNELQLIVQ